MAEILTVGDVAVEVVQKNVKNLHLTVHPPDGRVRVTAPLRLDMDAIRLFALSKLPWIRRQQRQFVAQEREPAREYLDRESHWVWGQRYLLRIVERDAPPTVEVGHSELVLFLRPNGGPGRREEVLAAWYRAEVRAAALPLMAKWSAALGVAVRQLFVQRMKTKWGSCNPAAATIRLNTELGKKPPECLEYVMVHELCHLFERAHNERFRDLMDRYLPGWTHVQGELNRSPLAHVDWGL